MSIRTLLAAIFASLARTEAEAAQADIREKRPVIVPKPTRYYRNAQARAALEPEESEP